MTNQARPHYTIMYGPYRGQDVSTLPIEYLDTILETCDPTNIELFEAAHFWFKLRTGKEWRQEG